MRDCTLTISILTKQRSERLETLHSHRSKRTEGLRVYLILALSKYHFMRPRLKPTNNKVSYSCLR